jgi:hypothetical protein
MAMCVISKDSVLAAKAGLSNWALSGRSAEPVTLFDTDKVELGSRSEDLPKEIESLTSRLETTPSESGN